jgi:hypothetical protein
MPAAQLLDRYAGVRFPQEANDLFFGKALLHVQSPSSGYWTLNRGATQIREDVGIIHRPSALLTAYRGRWELWTKNAKKWEQIYFYSIGPPKINLPPFRQPSFLAEILTPYLTHHMFDLYGFSPAS